MNIKIQSVKFDADQRLLDFTEAKLNKLERFIERVTLADVALKLDKDHDRGNKVAVIKLEVPGEDLVAESRAKSFEEAVDLAIGALKKQIDKRKDKLTKKAGAGVGA